MCDSKCCTDRLEIYCGKKQHLAESNVDDKAGPSAVLRNMQKVMAHCPPASAAAMRVVVTDRFYTSVSLATTLLAHGFYTVSTVMTNRLGFCAAVKDPRKKRQAVVPRGSFQLAVQREDPRMLCVSWMDSKPVHCVATGSARGQKTCSKFFQVLLSSLLSY